MNVEAHRGLWLVRVKQVKSHPEPCPEMRDRMRQELPATSAKEKIKNGAGASPHRPQAHRGPQGPRIHKSFTGTTERDIVPQGHRSTEILGATTQRFTRYWKDTEVYVQAHTKRRTKVRRDQRQQEVHPQNLTRTTGTAYRSPQAP